MDSRFPSLLVSVPKGAIDLSWGHPSERLHPKADVEKAIAHMFKTKGVIPLQYGPEQGFGPLLESLASFLSNEPGYTLPVTPECLYVTAGASQALDMLCTLLTQAGDVIYVEEPTYYLVSKIFNDHHLRMVGVPTDAHGIRPDALEVMLNDTRFPNPTILYTIPTFHNPMGNVLPAERRKALVELAKRHNFTIASDEAYHLLYYGKIPPSPLATFDTSKDGVVVSLGSFSKILAPGLHLGWIQAKPPIVKRFVDMGLSTSGGSMNQFTANVVHSVIELGLLDKNIAFLRKTYSERVQAMSEALKRHLSDEVEFIMPEGGYFFWLRCKKNIDTEKLWPIAMEMGVTFRPGQAFSPSRVFPREFRLTFALCESDEIEEGVRRLAEAFSHYHGTYPARA